MIINTKKAINASQLEMFVVTATIIKSKPAIIFICAGIW